MTSALPDSGRTCSVNGPNEWASGFLRTGHGGIGQAGAEGWNAPGAGGALAGTAAWNGGETARERRDTVEDAVNAIRKQAAFFGAATSFRDFFVSYWDEEPWLLRTEARDLVSGSALEKDTPIPWKRNSRAMTIVAAFGTMAGICIPYRLMGQP